MQLTISVGRTSMALCHGLLQSRYRGWSEQELLSVLVGVELYTGLLNRAAWEYDRCVAEGESAVELLGKEALAVLVAAGLAVD